jgi:hypothetical protein
MLKTIAEVSTEILSFIETLELPLSKPQKQHVAQVADALITSEGDKNLSALYRNIVGDPCPKSAADTFREAPWTADDIRVPMRVHLVGLLFKMAEEMGLEKRVFLSLDDSGTDKDKHSTRLEMVDWMIDLARSFPRKPVFTKGTVYVLLRITIGPLSFSIDVAPYLRAKTIRRLNRKRSKGERLTFRSKIQIALDMLEAVAPLIPPGYKVTLLFDSWYAAASILKWCRTQDWHVICRLKSNRSLNGMQVKTHNQQLTHRRYDYVRVNAVDEERPKIYLVRSLVGKLSSLPDNVRVFISKRHSRDSRPRYFASTDSSLSAHRALNDYHTRWSCEVVNWYFVERLGWADCRLWQVESAEKFLMVLWLALAFLEFLQVTQHLSKSLADIIRIHRQTHAERLLTQACQLAIRTRRLDKVLTRYTFAPAPT